MQRLVSGPMVLLLLALAGCTMLNGSPEAPASAPQGDLAARLDETRHAAQQALALWDRIILGESVSCQESIDAPASIALGAHDRTQIPQAELFQNRLNAAIQALHDSADLWNIECADTRPLVPLAMAREGRAAALAAESLLDEAQDLLRETAWQNISEY